MVICPAGLGDEVQAIKSGLLEIADIYAVNKADSPYAERTEQEGKPPQVHRGEPLLDHDHVGSVHERATLTVEQRAATA